MQNYLELLDCVWKHCSSCRNGLYVETPLYSVLEDRLKNLSLDIFSLLFFGNNSVHRDYCSNVCRMQETAVDSTICSPC